MAKSKVAVIGCGNWGMNLVRTTAAQGSLAMICDENEALLKKAASLAPDAVATTKMSEVLESTSVEAVMVATPSPYHFPHAKSAILAGKHVYVEKPLTLSVADAEELVALAEGHKRILMVGHLLKYHSAVLHIKKMIDSGDLGELYYVYSHRLNLGVIRKEENALWSLAPHDISVLLFFIGSEPTEVKCTGHRFIQNQEDIAFVTLEFPDRKVGHIHVSWLDPHKTRKFTVVGSRKMVVFDDMESSEKIRVYDKGVDFPEDGSYEWPLSLRFGEISIPALKMEEPLRSECHHFLDCVETGKTPRTDGKEGLQVVRVLNAAQESLTKGGASVSLARFPVSASLKGNATEIDQ